MNLSNRRYDIDWLRVIAIWLLVFYHVAIGFRPWGSLIGFIVNSDFLSWLEIPMAMLSVWRIPLLFFVSGMGVCFAMRKRDWQQLLTERTRRILLPLVFGAVAIVPIHMLAWQYYYHQDINYFPHRGHLWFLGNIFVYVLIFVPFFTYLKHNANGKISKALKAFMAHPLGLVGIIIPFVLEAVILQPNPFELYALNWHGFWLGLLAFGAGYLMVFAGQPFWDRLVKMPWIWLVLAVSVFLVRLLQYNLKSPLSLMALESNLWVFAVLAFGTKYLNRPSKALSYLSQAAYPVYILHMAFLYGASYLLFPLEMSGTLKFFAVSGVTLVGCYLSFELIRRVKVLRPLFGLKA